MGILSRLRGRQNRAYLTNPARRLRGSFPAIELLANNTFADGTSGWSVSGVFSGSVSDRVMRSSVVDPPNASPHPLRQSPAAGATVQFAPYCLRMMLVQGRGSFTGFRLRAGLSATDASYFNGVNSLAYGLRTDAFIVPATSAFIGVVDATTSGLMAGDYIEIPYASFSRCALVDIGSNLLLRSDEIDNAAWTKQRSSATANATTAPDSTSTAESIVEDATATQTHYFINASGIAVSSAAIQYTFGIALKAGARTWAQIRIQENIDAGAVRANINLATGALGVVTVGANWVNARASVQALGNGWYYVSITGRKTNAATSLSVLVLLSTGDEGTTYTGDGTSNIYAWRATLAQSGAPMRLVQTTTAAVAGSSPTGSAMHIKGLPSSTDGLLLPADEFEIITSKGSELKIVTAALNSDAAGLGYLQFEPPLRGTVADNAPVIVHEPMGRFIFTGDLAGWDNEPGIFTRASAEFEEA